ncbi:FHA domain-containing protein FhaB/FipA [Dermabacteraceae bacterium P13101]|nr:FHA domain-containing protein [Dermabacteraceae bacterium TAE3-ERU5]
MSELTLIALRLTFVVALWLFVVIALLLLRRDMRGTSVVERPRTSPAAKASPKNAAPAAAPAAPAFVTTLVVTEGPLRGTSLTLHSAPVLIGRAPECTLVLDDEYVSSRHARIMNRGGEWFVEDLGSKNGTLLAGRTIDSPVPFKPGATLRIGRTEVELRRGPR